MNLFTISIFILANPAIPVIVIGYLLLKIIKWLGIGQDDWLDL